MSHLRPSAPFATASLLPAGCLMLGAIFGGVWCFAALASITVLVVLMDRSGVEMAASVRQTIWLPRMIGAAHFLVLASSIWSVGQPDHLAPGAAIAQLVGAGLFVGQVSNACAHELIHRPDRLHRILGTAIYCSILNGQHVSAHLLVHHVYAGTKKDPNSAPIGQGYWLFAWHASIAEFCAGLRAENQRRVGRTLRAHPYVTYVTAAVFSLGMAAVLAGTAGIAALLLLSVHAQMQLLLSDYLQHYGLRRQIDVHGKPEPMGPQHSWNAPQAYSAALMLNAPLHSDHHMNPTRPFSALHLDTTTMPTLPRSVPVMGAIALFPPLWRQIMDPRAQRFDKNHSNVMPTAVHDTSPAPAVLSE